MWTILFLAYTVTFFAASNHTSFYPVRAHPFYSVDGLSKTDTAAKLFHIPPLTNELHLDGVTKPFLHDTCGLIGDEIHPKTPRIVRHS